MQLEVYCHTFTHCKPALKKSKYLQKGSFKPMRHLCYIWLMLIAFHVSGQQPFAFEGRQVQPGTKSHFTVEIASEEHETFIPITIFHGTADGPVLGITAGVHGYEYSPILAGQQLIQLIDVSSLKGTVILVQAANVESFLGRSPYINPKDGKNLNRSFPGDPEGTLTDRIAHYISTKVIPKCTYFIDAHSGDAPEDLIPYSGYYSNEGMPEVSKRGKELAMNLGFDYVLTFETTGKEYMQEGSPSLYCSAQAFKLGIPAADIECGRLGMVEPTYVNLIVDGLTNLMNALGMTPGKPKEIGTRFIVEERATVKSEHTGFFYPAKAAGDYVTKGMKIGHITDFFNRDKQEVFASSTGVLLYVLGTPPVNSGETLASIGITE